MNSIEDQMPRLKRWQSRIQRNWKDYFHRSYWLIVGSSSAILAILILAIWIGNLGLIVAAAIPLIGFGFSFIRDVVSSPLSHWFTRVFEQKSYGKPISYMADIRSDLGYLDRKLRKHNERILVIIDDLDRCEPEKSVEVLQAINLLLNFESFVVCLGVDVRLITGAINKYYGDVLKDVGASGYEYLDKIIQIPFRIPRPDTSEIEFYLYKQMDTSDTLHRAINNATSAASQAVISTPPNSETNSQFESAAFDSVTSNETAFEPSVEMAFSEEELTAFQSLSRYIKPNPRYIKRLINVYRLVRTLAEYRGDQIVLQNPKKTIQWLMIAGQWPYTTHVMLRYLKKMTENLDEETLASHLSTDAVSYLFSTTERMLSSELLGELDDDLDLLKLMLQRQDAGMSWQELKSIQNYTINFNPTIEEKKPQLELSLG
jgi:hypothetical protein